MKKNFVRFLELLVMALFWSGMIIMPPTTIAEYTLGKYIILSGLIFVCLPYALTLQAIYHASVDAVKYNIYGFDEVLDAFSESTAESLLCTAMAIAYGFGFILLLLIIKHGIVINFLPSIIVSLLIIIFGVGSLKPFFIAWEKVVR